MLVFIGEGFIDNNKHYTEDLKEINMEVRSIFPTSQNMIKLTWLDFEFVIKNKTIIWIIYFYYDISDIKLLSR